MRVGFDYGTSNCAMSYIDQGKAALVPLYGDDAFVPSTLYAIERGFIAEQIAQQLQDPVERQAYAQARSGALAQSRAGKLEHDIAQVSDGLFYGADAIAHYIAAPGEGYFIKSPKSFLGASGLRPQMVGFFEDLVAVMMLNVKQRAEHYLQREASQVVIGRPVNFQGINAHESNQQAQAILSAAAKRIGFRDIEFLFEPLAAGFDFETRLNENKIVLVVDVGGGTTDCSMVLMGPAHRNQLQREQDFLGHTGERIGGNDFDILLAQKALMPSFGMLSPLKTGLPMPLMPFVNAMAINDIGAQTDFYDAKTGFLLEKLQRETLEPELLNRFITMREDKHNFAVVREAELGKIALSSANTYRFPLGFIEADLTPETSAQDYAGIVNVLLQKIANLINEATTQAGHKPDIVYITGGSAKSPLIRKLVCELLGEHIEIIDGDHFGSVAAGLGVWAERVFA
ncbi:molecular chaperone [Cellvibrio mixtus]|uniref:molecular chaperone n=1 Tax=Cellvibrio mixtus TaxID=39650 RepID=UPI0005878B60|nr:molecular chaperone [Cellvibrio mixtus]